MVADTVRVNFMMSKENLKRVDEACSRWGVSRTAFINFACMNFLH
jgi:ACT domain-containing protein